MFAALLAGWSALWYGVLYPTTTIAPLLGATALAAPALACAIAAGRGSRLAFACSGFVALIYIAHGVMEFSANGAEQSAALVAIGLALALLVAASHALRGMPRRTD